MTTPREPDRFDKIALDIWGGDFTPAGFAAALRAVESEALERAAQVVDDEDEGPHGMDYQLGDVSDFRARCVKAICALKQSHERSNDEVANVELRMSSTAVDAAGVGRDAPVPSQEKAPGHPTSDALIPPAAAPAAETLPMTTPRREAILREHGQPAPAAETGHDKVNDPPSGTSLLAALDARGIAVPRLSLNRGAPPVAETGADPYAATWKEAAEEWRTEAKKAEARIAELEAALHEIVKLIDEGALVRNIEADGQPGWTLKAMRLVVALKHAYALLPDLAAPVAGEEGKR